MQVSSTFNPSQTLPLSTIFLPQLVKLNCSYMCSENQNTAWHILGFSCRGETGRPLVSRWRMRQLSNSPTLGSGIGILCHMCRRMIFRSRVNLSVDMARERDKCCPLEASRRDFDAWFRDSCSQLFCKAGFASKSHQWPIQIHRQN